MSLRKSTQRQHVPGPAFVCHVQKEHPGSIGIVGAVYPGQEVIDVILGKHHLFDSGKQLRLLLPHPQKLRSREAGKGDVGRPLGEPVPAHGLVQVGNLLCCPAVVPQNGGADRPGPPRPGPPGRASDRRRQCRPPGSRRSPPGEGGFPPTRPSASPPGSAGSSPAWGIPGDSPWKPHGGSPPLRSSAAASLPRCPNQFQCTASHTSSFRNPGCSGSHRLGLLYTKPPGVFNQLVKISHGSSMAPADDIAQGEFCCTQ